MSRLPALSPRTGLALLLLLGAALAAAYVFWDAPEDTAAHAPSSTSSAGPQTPGQTSSAAVARRADGDQVMAQAVQLFHIGYAGGLQLDEDTRAALDTLVNSLPENPTAEDLARVDKAVRLSLSFEDAERALRLVHGHIGYKSEVSGMLASSEPPANADELHRLFERVDAIQHRHFTPEAEQALFGPNAREARTLLEIMTVQQDPTLTDAQKQQRIEALRPGATQAASAPVPAASQP